MTATNTRQSILVVDDDAVFRRRLARAFVDRDYDATEAGDYDAALALARLESPELAVIDLKMPGRSGLELARDLLGLDATTRITILSGYGSVATAVEAMRVGVAWYLPKPADADDILAAFARAAQPPLTDATHEFDVPTLERAKWEHIQRVLSDSGGVVSVASRRLGVHRRSLQRILARHPPRK